MLTHSYQKGDTIIEVLLAVTIFSMVAVGALQIMSQGTNTAQRAIEITLVRQQIDSQVEAIRAAHQQASTQRSISGTEWEKITNVYDATATPFVVDELCPETQAEVSDSFVMQPYTAQKLPLVGSTWYKSPRDVTAPPFAQIVTDPAPAVSYGLWIEPVLAGGVGTTPGAYTFRVRACWESVGVSKPMTLETVVKLYEI